MPEMDQPGPKMVDVEAIAASLAIITGTSHEFQIPPYAREWTPDGP
jgi:hypothetical protein